MNNIGLEINIRDYLKNGTGEESKSFRIVIVAVDRVTLEIILVVNKIIDNAVVLSFKNSAILTSPCNGNRNVSDKLHCVLELLLDCVIHRKNNTAADKPLSQCMRQRSCNITESAARNERECLRGGI